MLEGIFRIINENTEGKNMNNFSNYLFMKGHLTFWGYDVSLGILSPEEPLCAQQGINFPADSMMD